MDVQETTKLSIITNKVVGDLPNELLTKVFEQLSRAAIKNVRLTSKQWNELSASLMFERIYFSPTKIVIDNFALITSNPLLCKNVTEVVYDAAVFSVDCLSPQSIEKKRELVMKRYYERSGTEYEPLSNSQLLHATENLQRLYEEQQDILNNARDTKALIAGLKNLPRLEDLSVLARRHFPDKAIFAGVDHYPDLRYEQKLDELINSAVLPEEDVLRATYFPLPVVHDPWQEILWSSLGVNHLFEVSGLGQKYLPLWKLIRLSLRQL